MPPGEGEAAAPAVRRHNAVEAAEKGDPEVGAAQLAARAPSLPAELTTAELAERTRTSVQTVLNAIYRSKLAARQVEGRWLVETSEAERWAVEMHSPRSRGRPHPLAGGRLTTAEVAALRDTSPQTVLNAIYEGKLRGRKVEGRWLVEPPEAERWAAEMRAREGAGDAGARRTGAGPSRKLPPRPGLPRGW